MDGDEAAVTRVMGDEAATTTLTGDEVDVGDKGRGIAGADDAMTMTGDEVATAMMKGDEAAVTGMMGDEAVTTTLTGDKIDISDRGTGNDSMKNAMTTGDETAMAMMGGDETATTSMTGDEAAVTTLAGDEPVTTLIVDEVDTLGRRRRHAGPDSPAAHEESASALLRHRLRQDSARDMAVARGVVDSQPHQAGADSLLTDDHARLDRASYWAARAQTLDCERAMGFDARWRARATPLEARANRLLAALRRRDDALVYARAQPRQGHAGQTHPRFAADRFLANLDLVADAALLDVARHLPKGAHLHVHYNACLPPAVLIGLAARMARMFVTSDRRLVADDGGVSFAACELQFSVLGPHAECPGDIFAPGYRPRQTMRFSDFLSAFPRFYPRADVSPERWLEQKLVFSEHEAHGPLQTPDGAWQGFNARTRMMKGLFNYETAFRAYTRLFLEDLTRDGILYVEIRLNFMRSNQLRRDDGSGTIDNPGIMRILVDVVSAFRAEVAAGGRRFFGGVKVIYCTPRASPPDDVGAALDECLALKKQWPEWIAGFDLVGEESKGRPLKDFVGPLLDFQHRCAAAGVDVPLLLHCGETLEVGTATDENVVDALLLGARRIGHGFALTRHPHVLRQMKARGVCVELCPISNEVLGLTPRVGGHAMYALLAGNVHCTVNSDNGAMFRSTLSHDFYQVMAGKANMDIFGWKQLALWSLEHACLDEAERAPMLREWERQWTEFLEWMFDTYGSTCPGA